MDLYRQLALPILQEQFPRTAKYRRPWAVQEQMLSFVAEEASKAAPTAKQTTVIIESGTGTGKTAVEYTILQAMKYLGGKTLFLITPNKTLVDQIKQEFPTLTVALGRNEHPCLYYHEPADTLTPERVAELYNDPENPRANQVPCSVLQDCPHRVDQETGRTHQDDAIPCPYLQQKYLAKREGSMVLATTSFFLFNTLFSRDFDQPDCLVIDEAHRLAQVIRGSLSYDITDHYVSELVDLLRQVGSTQAVPMLALLKVIKNLTRRKPPGREVMMKDQEIAKVIEALEGIDSETLTKDAQRALHQGLLNKRVNLAQLKQLETIARDLRRYLTSLSFCLSTPTDNPLNYVCAYHYGYRENQRVRYKLVVKAFCVTGIIKRVLGRFNVAMSATIGNRDVFGHETGLRGPFLSLPSPFDGAKARIYMPEDTPNLAVKKVGRGQRTQLLRRVVRAAKHFATRGHRSLIVTISNEERQSVLKIAAEEKLQALSYGNGTTAKEMAIRFRQGEGEALVGTSANYAEGVDLPKQTAPVIWFLRPGYPRPDDPLTQFEEKRFGRQRWRHWQWRVVIQALQVRGRNIRSQSDVGVTFFLSQQFRNFLFGSLPKPLQEEAYRGQWTFDQCVKDADKLLA